MRAFIPHRAVNNKVTQPHMTCPEFEYWSNRCVRIATHNGGEMSLRFTGVTTQAWLFEPVEGGETIHVRIDRLTLMVSDGPGVQLHPDPVDNLPHDWRCPKCQDSRGTTQPTGLVTCINGHESL